MGSKDGGVDSHTKLQSEDTNVDGNMRVVRERNPITSCGCVPCTPSWAQFLVNPKLFTFHCAAIIALMIGSLAYFGGVLTTIERQFKLSSSESGTITIIYDLVSLSLVLPISYFGHSSHRPRWVASGVMICGFGFFLFSMPHFASDPLDPSTLLYGQKTKSASVCRPESSSTYSVISVEGVGNNSSYPPTFENNNTLHIDECETSSNGLGPIWWLVIGNILAGIGSAPLFPLVTTYIDDAVGKRRLVSYTGFLFMALAIGPSCGFLLSSRTTQLYVDFYRVPADQIPDIDQSDPRWIGAWWLGFAIFGALMMLLGVPMFFYPKLMINQTSEDAEEAKTNQEGGDNFREAIGGKSIFDRKEGQNGIIDTLKGLMFTMKRLITNMTLMAMCLGSSAETAAIGIFAAFSVKYLQTQFGLSPGTAAMFVGGAIVPCNIVSNLVSAWIVRRFKFTSRQCALFVIVVLSCSGTLLPVLMATGCENPDIGGISVPYNSFESAKLETTTYLDTNNPVTNHSLSPAELEESQLTASCNADCGCSTEVFQPVCGSDGITYISACHAGCKAKVENASLSQNVTGTVYINCGCTSPPDNPDNSSTVETATSGPCPIECDSYKLPLFVALCAASFFLTTLTGNPIVFIVLRCVEDDDRSVALGLKSLITKVLGFFPSPVYFGAIINATCIYWQYTCGDRGACWIYDIVKYRYSYFGTLLVLRILSIFCYSVMYLSIKPEKSKNTSEDRKHSDETLQLELQQN